MKPDIYFEIATAFAGIDRTVAPDRLTSPRELQTINIREMLEAWRPLCPLQQAG